LGLFVVAIAWAFDDDCYKNNVAPKKETNINIKTWPITVDTIDGVSSKKSIDSKENIFNDIHQSCPSLSTQTIQ
jgi:hypothetical protein